VHAAGGNGTVIILKHPPLAGVTADAEGRETGAEFGPVAARYATCVKMRFSPMLALD